MTNHISLDIETLGTGPDSVILSIGACRFDPRGDQVEVNSIAMAGFSCTVDVLDQLLLGRTIDPGTLSWWRDQSDEAKDGVLGEVRGASRSGDVFRHTLRGALRKFGDWVYTAEPTGVTVWANSPSFDCVILHHAYNMVGLDFPWSFRNQRDLRTVCDLAEVDKTKIPTGRDHVAHSALDDAIFQARVIQECYRKTVKS